MFRKINIKINNRILRTNSYEEGLVTLSVIKMCNFMQFGNEIDRKE